MKAKMVKVTDKGQISLPISFRKTTGIEKGDDLLMLQSENTIIIEKLKESRFRDLLKHSEKVAKKLWSNKEDDIWDNV
ncbi:AbrB/MazE/SpoVT family DNA-binding domain-containing protein [Candidatus Woesearchaeota archaeon]|nr:AbrB/MazE/SpoVT family DNA-binding domain-containing protein [Candidatus Woesearchaeota archaeon]